MTTDAPVANPNNRDYSNGEIIVHWRPDNCVKCKLCTTGLPQVFNVDARPWVNMKGATTAEIVAQCEQCPDGALTTSRV